jgi:hypothetical protein
MPAAKQTCVVPGCDSDAKHQLGVRMRFPPGPNADWAPETGLYVRDHHARSGARIALLYQPTNTGRIDTSVQVVGPPIMKRKPIR